MISTKHFPWFKEYKRRQRVALLKDIGEGIACMVLLGAYCYLLIMLAFILK